MYKYIICGYCSSPCIITTTWHATLSPANMSHIRHFLLHLRIKQVTDHNRSGIWLNSYVKHKCSGQNVRQPCYRTALIHTWLEIWKVKSCYIWILFRNWLGDSRVKSPPCCGCWGEKVTVHSSRLVELLCVPLFCVPRWKKQRKSHFCFICLSDLHWLVIGAAQLTST